MKNHLILAIAPRLSAESWEFYASVINTFPDNEWFAPRNSETSQDFDVCAHLQDWGFIERRDTPQFKTNGNFAGNLVEFKIVPLLPILRDQENELEYKHEGCGTRFHHIGKTDEQRDRISKEWEQVKAQLNITRNLIAYLQNA